MHQYLRAIGFSNIKNLHQLDRIHREIQRTPDRRMVVSRSLRSSLVQLNKDYGAGGIGLSVLGEMDSEDSFLIEHSFPYIQPGNYVHTDEVQVDKFNDRSGYYGMIDNINLSVIFTLINVAEITDYMWKAPLPSTLSVRLSGLSLGGDILLPLMKTEQDLQYECEKMKEDLATIHMIRHGHQELLDRMMLREMDLKDTIDHRIDTEDVLSIVDSSMIPSGLQSDVYDIIGTIVDMNEIENVQTGEHVMLLDVACLYYVIRIAVNKNDLHGEPDIGRRFHGITWLQGSVLLDIR